MELNRQSLWLEIFNQRVELLPERAVFIESTRTLLVADLHWAKAETFQASGIRIPSQILHSDLQRLSAAAALTRAARVLVLGDLVHSPRHLSPEFIAEVAHWRKSQNFSLELVPGNHDRHLKMPSEWNIRIHSDPLSEADFEFSHDPAVLPKRQKKSHKFLWSGHIHPMLRLKSRFDSLRAPCFVLQPQLGLLPAFSEFTGGVDQSPQANEKYFIVADNQVIALE